MKVRKEGAGLFIRRMESLTSCAETCRSNFDSVENQIFDCHGFSIIGIDLEKRCEFYDESADEIPLHTLTSMESKSTYFEKQCMAIPSHCTNGAFSFELQKDRILFVSPIESIVVDDRKRTCQVLDKTCRAVAGGLVQISGVDHYENTCVQDDTDN
uniref:Apple domain-containing protein n=1 Tax=Panagrolaimus superbus TaxID=310955 RepID=A0A914XUU4_9BILA